MKKFLKFMFTEMFLPTICIIFLLIFIPFAIPQSCNRFEKDRLIQVQKEGICLTYCKSSICYKLCLKVLAEGNVSAAEKFMKEYVVDK